MLIINSNGNISGSNNVVYIYILGQQDRARKGGRSLLPVGAKEHMDLELP
jgi:hypothetical protein